MMILQALSGVYLKQFITNWVFCCRFFISFLKSMVSRLLFFSLITLVVKSSILYMQSKESSFADLYIYIVKLEICFFKSTALQLVQVMALLFTSFSCIVYQTV